MAQMTVNLSDTMQEYIFLRVSSGEFETSDQFIAHLIEKAMTNSGREQIEAMLLEAEDDLENGRVSPWTDDDVANMKLAAREKYLAKKNLSS